MSRHTMLMLVAGHCFVRVTGKKPVAPGLVSLLKAEQDYFILGNGVIFGLRCGYRGVILHGRWNERGQRRRHRDPAEAGAGPAIAAVAKAHALTGFEFVRGFRVQSAAEW